MWGVVCLEYSVITLTKGVECQEGTPDNTESKRNKLIGIFLCVFTIPIGRFKAFAFLPMPLPRKHSGLEGSCLIIVPNII